MKIKKLVKEVDVLMECLMNRGFRNRDRLLRKLIEESGEYAEAIEYNNGSTRKIAKYAGLVSAKEKLDEEVVDLVMITLALAHIEGFSIKKVLLQIFDKLNLREKEYHKK